MKMNTLSSLVSAAVVAAALTGTSAFAQVTPSRSAEAADDSPSVKLGGLIFADYTYQDQPTKTDADGNTIHPSSFNVSRAYINATGNISHLISFRVTTDIKADTNDPASDKSLSGSNVVRLKYAYGQLNLDDAIGKGGWVRLGLQQTPWIDYEEGIYRYRFQGPVFVDREGFLTSSDYAIAGHYNLPANYGDLQLGVYNGEGYGSLADNQGTNDQKAFQARFSLRPAPGIDVLNGLRLTAFYDGDDYLKGDKKQRFVGNATFEYKYLNAGFDYLDAKDQTSSSSPQVHAQGYSVWATPRTPFGLEALLRYDSLKPNKDVSARKKRTIAGVGYWFPVLKGVSAALLADYEQVKYDVALNKPNEKRYALHAQFGF